MLLWWYIPRAGRKIFLLLHAKSVPAFAVLGVVNQVDTSAAVPYDPSPRRLSGEFGCGLPLGFGQGSACVTGSSMWATRVWTRSVVRSSDHPFKSSQNRFPPSPVNWKSNAPPVLI